MWSDVVEEIDPDLFCDRLLYNVVNTSIGITMTRKIYAWAQQHHDNYFIYEYIFKNTGNVDKDAEIEKPSQTLENVYFFYQYRYAVSREGATWTGLNSPRWGISQMLTSRGEAKKEYSVAGFTYNGDYEDWLNGDPAADSLRCQLAWAGRHSSATYDLLGYPDVRYKSGRLSGPQFVGNVTLHADVSATDKSDDPQQPTTTTFQQSDDPPTRPNDQFDAARMSEEWKWVTRGHRLPRHDELVGNGFPDQLEGTPGGFSNMNGYGPYTLGPGDSIRLVIAEGVNGLNRQLCEEIGRNWIKGNSPYTLPDGSTTTDKDVYKNSWVMTGMDSLFKTFGRSRRNFNLNFEIPMPPPPPNVFDVNSGGDRIRLSWSNNAEAHPGFAGYRVYRAVAKYDTTYTQIFACGKNTNHPTIVNSYDDTSAVRGYSYYYYLTSFDDGSNNV
ncbi:MAG: fibronectin, partial [bacterium]|nr:fibronectin [bacterium]